MNVRRAAGSVVFAGIAIYLASQGSYLGLIAVVLAYFAGIASVALGPAWLGSPGRPRPRYGAAAAGSAFGLILAGTAAALNLYNVVFVVIGAGLAFVGGLLLGLIVIRYPDAPP